MQVRTKQTLQYFFQVAKRHWVLSCLILLGVLGGVGTTMGEPIVLKYFINAMSDNAGENLMKYFYWIIGLGLLQTIFWRVAAYSNSILQPKGMREISDDCFEQLHNHSFNYFNNQFVGSLVKRVNRMSRSFEDITDQFFFEFFPIFLKLVTVVIVLATLKPLFGLAIFIWTLLFLLIHVFIAKYKLRKYDIPKVEADTRATAALADSITNNSTIKLFARLPFEVARFKSITQDWAQKTMRSWIFSQHIEGLQGLFMVLLEGVIFYEAIQLWGSGTLTVGDFVLIQSYLLLLFQQVWDFGRILRRLYESMADAQEMTEILQTPIEVKDKSGAKALEIRRGQVEFEKVSFSYSDKNEVSGEEESSVMNQLSLKVKAGERVALIGPSGGGKTTFVKLLLRLFDVHKGKILIDGQDISKVTQDSLRSQVALVPQDPILFHRSLKDNIRYGSLEATNEEVIAAAKMARCHEFIDRLPKKYDTFVGERGVKLSGGERQRVAIARAILANTKIMILDEATSSLDSESEKLIKEALQVLMRKKTVFVIAHRLSTVVDMDRILVLEKGQVVEEGSHAELLKKEDGLYKRLWDLQVGGYLE